MGNSNLPPDFDNNFENLSQDKQKIKNTIKFLINESIKMIDNNDTNIIFLNSLPKMTLNIKLNVPYWIKLIGYYIIGDDIINQQKYLQYINSSFEELFNIKRDLSNKMQNLMNNDLSCDFNSPKSFIEFACICDNLNVAIWLLNKYRNDYIKLKGVLAISAISGKLDFIKVFWKFCILFDSSTSFIIDPRIICMDNAFLTGSENIIKYVIEQKYKNETHEKYFLESLNYYYAYCRYLAICYREISSESDRWINIANYLKYVLLSNNVKIRNVLFSEYIDININWFTIELSNGIKRSCLKPFYILNKLFITHHKREYDALINEKTIMMENISKTLYENFLTGLENCR